MGSQNYSGQRFGQYELGDLLGVGGMGAVYRAYQPGLKRTVAVKVLPLMRGEEYSKRFIREATTSASLEHAHIIPIYDFGTEKGISYIVMRLLTGGSLEDRIENFIQEGKPLPGVREISGFLRQLASALDYAHGKGVIHRDIKPSNVMFDDQGAAYLVDFGIAKLSDATGGLTGTNMTVGTPQYMPPEQWRGETVEPASDQYALAVMVYHLVTGRLPFEAPTPFALMHKHVYETPTPPTAFRSDLPPGIVEVLNRALSKTPPERYPSVSAFAQAFENASQETDAGSTGIFARPLPTPLSQSTMPRPLSPSVNTAARQKTTLTRIAPVAAGGTVVIIAFAALGFLIAQTILQPARPTNIAALSSPEVSPSATSTQTLTKTPIPPTLTPIPPTVTLVPTVAKLTPTDPPTLDIQAIARSTINAVETIDAEVTRLAAIRQGNQTATARAWTATHTNTPGITPSKTPTVVPSNTASRTATPIPPTIVIASPTLAPTLTPIPPTQIILPSPWSPTPKPVMTVPPLITATPNLDDFIREVTRAGTRTIVYAQPSTSSTAVVTLFVGDRVRLSEKTYGSGNNQWVEVILADDRSGWIKFQTGILEMVDPNATTDGFQIGTRVRVTANGGNLNLRASPSTSAARVKVVPTGTTMVIIGGPKRGGYHMWWQFTLADGTQGWVIDISDWFEVY